MSQTYAIVTPAHNEAAGLDALVASIAAQTVTPSTWVIVENGSTDETLRLARDAAERHSWICVVESPSSPRGERGAPIVHALHVGLEALRPFPDAVAQLDADITLPPDYFERLLAVLEEEADVGIVGGTCYELEAGRWRQRHVTSPNVWGAARVYRRECLEAVLPFEPRTGWDAIDVAHANALGWQTRTLLDLPFKHNRREASRELTRWRAWADQGRTSHFLGYRPSYLAARAIFRAVRDPTALGLIAGYVGAFARRRPRCARPGVREWVRAQQRLRATPRKASEARGHNRR